MKQREPEDQFAIICAVAALVMGIIGALWTGLAIGMGGSTVVILLGVLFVVIALVQGVVSLLSLSKRPKAFLPGDAEATAPQAPPAHCPACGTVAAKGLRRCVKCGKPLS